ncbi:hypothetical protein HZH66_003285 [Vespula vulgaris]|uniref:Uncharacterized protein n=1 Tax=Vespula vulgaris TaxID=7454 RepID=A0A834KL62_VESVU|nr:hypothetical protein HZH66_003285 [Vespula vulgaris]
MAVCPKRSGGCTPIQWYIPIDTKFPGIVVEPACPKVNCPTPYTLFNPSPQTNVPTMTPCGWTSSSTFQRESRFAIYETRQTGRLSLRDSPGKKSIPMVAIYKPILSILSKDSLSQRYIS